MSLDGMQLGRYQLLRKLGSGNTGEVYLANDSLLQRQVAIKLARTTANSDPSPAALQDRASIFTREYREIARPGHPNISPVIDFGEQLVDGNRFEFAIMSYYPNGSLAGWMSARRDARYVSLYTSVHLIRQAANALQFAHDRSIVHQAVKPSNFLIQDKPGDSDELDLVLSDFSISNWRSVSSSTNSSSAQGNPLYMAPEQLIGKEPVFATDQYALAVIAYELLTGQPPFTGSTHTEIMYKHMVEQPLRPGLLNPDISSEIDWVILHGLAKKPEERFSSVSAFANALEQASAGLLARKSDNSNQSDEKALVFFSYAYQDRTLRDKLEEHLSNLKYRGLITTWHEREIAAGEEWKQQIDSHLDKAHIILVLISASFMASEYCYGIEMKRALERHGKGEAEVVPVLLRPVLLTGTPLAWLKMLPTNGKPVVSWRNRDSAYVDIALNIQRIVQERKKAQTRYPASPPPPVGVEQPSYGNAPQAQWAGQSAHPAPLPPLHPAPGYAPFPASPGRSPQAPARRSVLVGSGILLGLFALGVLLFQHSNFILPIVIGLLSLAGLAIAILLIGAIARNRREREAARRRQEEAQRQRQEETRRREQEQARKRKLAEEEARMLEQREEARRKEQEQDYYVKALVAYENALRLDPRDITALKGEANALDALGRYDKSLEAFQKAVVLDANSAIYSRIGDVLTKLKRYKDAQVAYEQAIALDPTYAVAYFNMGTPLDQSGKGQEAQQAREKAKQLGYEE